jgi:hypothetical protein
MHKKLPFNSELKLYNLSREDLNFFISTFVQCRFPYNIKLDENSGWLMRKFYGKRAPLDDYAIAGHLTGKYWVATFPGRYTTYLCLDLDDSKDLKATLDAVLNTFPKSLVIQSSITKGVHAYFFFDSKIGMNRLHKLIYERLNEHGIGVRPGYCEIFPQTNRALRLPLGKGSYVLDEATLTPLHTNVKDGIRLIKEKIIYHSINEILSQVKAGGKPTPSVPSLNETARNGATLSSGFNDSMAMSNSGMPGISWDKLRGKEFKDFINHALRSGIELTGTRYFIQSKLIYHFWSINYSKEQCYESISRWYFSHDHQSKDWKKNPSGVLHQLRNAINSFYRQAELKRYPPAGRIRKLLTTADVRYITELTADYRDQKFIFSLMEYALNAKNTKDEFRLPRTVITTFDCCSDKSYQDKMRLCEFRGLVTMTRQYFRQEKRARTYMINYTFCEDGIPVNNLEQGLKAIFDLETLRFRYSKWVYKKILREG